jgi:Zn-dependent peptidase ImmA (M78 family)
MGNPVSGINPKILVWARERSGLTIAQVAKTMGRPTAEVEAWESDPEAAPTYPQLEDLAYRVYKRPVALFFFPEPPDEEDPKHSFRTLPDFEIADLSADTRYKIRQAHALQLSLYELNGNTNPAAQKIFVDLHVQAPTDAPNVALKAREYLGITLDEQRSAWRDSTAALKAWRDAVEEKGVFVFKNTFKQKAVSGFCLSDDTFPLIYVNNSTAQTRQSFTILHELGHILLRTSGVTKRDDSYIAQLSGRSQLVEVFCNQFAGECLLPTSQIQQLRGKFSDEMIQEIASDFKVSRQVVLTRLRGLGRVTQSYYDQKTKEWNAEYEAQKAKTGGGNYYLTQASYLGERYLRLAFQKYYERAISMEQLADHLNVKVASVPGLEQLVLQHPTG